MLSRPTLDAASYLDCLGRESMFGLHPTYHAPPPPQQELQHSGRGPRADFFLLPPPAPLEPGPYPTLVPGSPRPCPPRPTLLLVGLCHYAGACAYPRLAARAGL